MIRCRKPTCMLISQPVVKSMPRIWRSRQRACLPRLLASSVREAKRRKRSESSDLGLRSRSNRVLMNLSAASFILPRQATLKTGVSSKIRQHVPQAKQASRLKIWWQPMMIPESIKMRLTSKQLPILMSHLAREASQSDQVGLRRVYKSDWMMLKLANIKLI